MKPCEKIRQEQAELKLAIIALVEKFREETGCVVDHISIDFVDVTSIGSERETAISDIRVVWS